MFDCERMKHSYTGLYSFCLHLGRALKRASNEEQQILYYAPKSCFAAIGEGATGMHQSSLHKFYFPLPNDIDVWHCTYQTSAYFPFRSKSKIVLTVHDLNFMYDDSKSNAKKLHYKNMVACRIEKADHIVCISNYVRNDLEKNGLLPLNKPCSVIYNAHALEIITLDTKHKPRFTPPGKFIFSLGVMSRKKNFHILPFMLEGNDLHLVIAGRREDPEYIHQILSVASSLGLSHRVHLLHNITELEKAWYLQNCVAFVLLSISEGFGIPVIEAMHFGKPVLLSRCTSLPEIGGTLAYYVHDFEKEHLKSMLAHTLADYIKYPEKKQAIQQHAQGFTWQTAASKYLDIYKQVVS